MHLLLRKNKIRFFLKKVDPATKSGLNEPCIYSNKQGHEHQLQIWLGSSKPTRFRGGWEINPDFSLVSLTE